MNRDQVLSYVKENYSEDLVVSEEEYNSVLFIWRNKAGYRIELELFLVNAFDKGNYLNRFKYRSLIIFNERIFHNLEDFDKYLKDYKSNAYQDLMIFIVKDIIKQFCSTDYKVVGYRKCIPIPRKKTILQHVREFFAESWFKNLKGT